MKSTAVNCLIFAATALIPTIGISSLAEPAVAQACTPPPAGAVPFERYYHNAAFPAHNRDHYYTTGPNPSAAPGGTIAVQGAGYVYESTEGLAYETQVPGTVPLYELYNGITRNHFYTTNQQDIATAQALAYQPPAPNQPPIAGYIFPDNSGNYCGATPLYRLYNAISVDHFYTTDPAEQDAAQRNAYRQEGIAGYILEEAAGVAARKNPVVIVGGTLTTELLYLNMESRLARDGYQSVFFGIPGGGLQDIRLSADALKNTVDNVLNTYNTDQVHLIGHSQGSLVSRTYIDRYRADNAVESMISLAGPHQGTSGANSELGQLLCLAVRNQPGPNACEQMAPNSALLQQVNNRPANDPIFYTNFTTNNDIFITPVENGWMPNCTNPINANGISPACNIHVQTQCPNQLLLDHTSLAINGAVYSGILQALSHDEIRLDCNAL
ncbi:MAG: alpha/beta fold hydrolase [Spirulinaceae cyanobacterium]